MPLGDIDKPKWPIAITADVFVHRTARGIDGPVIHESILELGPLPDEDIDKINERLRWATDVMIKVSLMSNPSVIYGKSGLEEACDLKKMKALRLELPETVFKDAIQPIIDAMEAQ